MAKPHSAAMSFRDSTPPRANHLPVIGIAFPGEPACESLDVLLRNLPSAGHGQAPLREAPALLEIEEAAFLHESVTAANLLGSRSIAGNGWLRNSLVSPRMWAL